jgi:cytochrome P450
MTATLENRKTLPPGPKPKYPGELFLRLRRDPTGFWRDLRDKYGDISTFQIAGERFVFISQPDYIRDVLVTHNKSFRKGRGLERAKIVLGNGLLTSEGELHLRQRRLAQPAFHRQRVESYAAIMTDYATRQADGWHSGRTYDMAQEMMRLTLNIVAKTLFDADVESEAPEIRASLTVLVEMFSLINMPYSDKLMKLPLPMVRRFYRAKERLDATIYRIIEERRKSGIDNGDLLSMLLLAQDTEGDGGRMSDEQLRDEAMTIFLAGHETTANALTWTWYLLSQNPAAEAKFHAELTEVLAGRVPTVADLPNLKYTHAVLSEAMRLYPPAWIMGRRVLEDFRFGNYVAPSGSIVLFSQYLMHRDERFWDAPEAFQPQRWLTEADKRPKFAYFPFGGGPRLCIGEQFAWMEGELILATIGQHWKMRLIADQKVVLQPLITLRPKHGIKMRLESFIA